MTIVVRGNNGALRSSISFFTSGLVHGLVLAWVAFGTPGSPLAEPKQRMYDMVIRGNEKRIIWYRLRDRLPDVAPAPARPESERWPLRATKKFDQTLVAGPKDDARAPRLVWAPPPEVTPPKPQPLPNVIAVEQRPLVKPFTPPVAKLVAPVTPALPDAPKVAEKLAPAPAGPELHPLVRKFVRPEQKNAAQAAPALPDAPQVSAKLAPAAAGPGLHPLVKPFVRPGVKSAAAGAPALPDAPRVAANLAPAPAGPGLHPLVKQFHAPTAPTSVPATPTVPDVPENADVPRLAIVGIDPAKAVDIPSLPAPREGGFSAGPKIAPIGAATDGGAAAITVPGLTVRGGAKDAQPTLLPKLGPPSMKTLLAGVRAAPPPPAAPEPHAAHVSSAPDPALEGRVVYSIAIQMPNVTSYSGSWIVWFAEHEASNGAAGEVKPPVPLRKVDPKYVASAAADGVQGIVRLSAIIRRNGHVDTIKLLRHLDDRLDASAMESLGKWEFEPAVRNGVPLDVDAVFEIPFRLAPKSPK